MWIIKQSARLLSKPLPSNECATKSQLPVFWLCSAEPLGPQTTRLGPKRVEMNALAKTESRRVLKPASSNELLAMRCDEFILSHRSAFELVWALWRSPLFPGWAPLVHHSRARKMRSPREIHHGGGLIFLSANYSLNWVAKNAPWMASQLLVARQALHISHWVGFTALMDMPYFWHSASTRPTKFIYSKHHYLLI